MTIPPRFLGEPVQWVPIQASGGPYEIQLKGFSGSRSVVAADISANHSVLAFSGSLCTWAAVRGDGLARIGWFTAAKSHSQLAGLEAFRRALDLAEGDAEILNENQSLFEDVEQVRSGVWPVLRWHGHVSHPELSEVRDALVASRPFTMTHVQSPKNRDYADDANPLMGAADVLAWILRRSLEEGFVVDEELLTLLGSVYPGISKAHRLAGFRNWVDRRRLGLEPRGFSPAESDTLRAVRNKALRNEISKKVRRPQQQPAIPAPEFSPDMVQGWKTSMPVGAAVAAVVDGWAWAAAIPTEAGGCEVFTGQVEARNLNQAIKRVFAKCDRLIHAAAPVVGRRRPGKGWNFPGYGKAVPASADVQEARLALAGYARSRLPYQQFMHDAVTDRLVLPEIEGVDPYTVACDASLLGGIVTWGCVTGAGWMHSGDQPGETIQHGELWAILRAVAMFPEDSDITVLTDNQSAVQIVDALQAGESLESIYNRVGWLRDGSHSKGGSPLHQLYSLLWKAGQVKVQWVKRGTHPLHDEAHRLAARHRWTSKAAGSLSVRPEHAGENS